MKAEKPRKHYMLYCENCKKLEQKIKELESQVEELKKQNDVLRIPKKELIHKLAIAAEQLAEKDKEIAKFKKHLKGNYVCDECKQSERDKWEKIIERIENTIVFQMDSDGEVNAEQLLKAIN